jgi:hypothetical protein
VAITLAITLSLAWLLTLEPNLDFEITGQVLRMTAVRSSIRNGESHPVFHPFDFHQFIFLIRARIMLLYS